MNKWIIVTGGLILCACTMATADDIGKIPMAGFCHQDPDSPAEVRFCKIFIAQAEKHKSFRKAVPPEPAMVFHFIVEEVPEHAPFLPGAEMENPLERPMQEEKMVALCGVIVFAHEELAGFQPTVSQKCAVIKACDYKKEIKKILDNAVGAIVEWLPMAVEASKNLCPEPPNKYESVDWMCDDQPWNQITEAENAD